MLRTPKPLTFTPSTGRTASGAHSRGDGGLAKSSLSSADSRSIRGSALLGGVTNFGLTRMRRVRTALAEMVSVSVVVTAAGPLPAAVTNSVVGPGEASTSMPSSARHTPSAARTNGISRSCQVPVTMAALAGAFTARCSTSPGWMRPAR